MSWLSLSAPMKGSRIPERSEITPKTWKTLGVCEVGAAPHNETPKAIRIAAPIQTPRCPFHIWVNETNPPGLASPYAPIKTMMMERSATRKAMMKASFPPDSSRQTAISATPVPRADSFLEIGDHVAADQLNGLQNLLVRNDVGIHQAQQ